MYDLGYNDKLNIVDSYGIETVLVMQPHTSDIDHGTPVAGHQMLSEVPDYNVVFTSSLDSPGNLYSLNNQLIF